MTKLYMKQAVFSWRDRFSVVDEQMNPAFSVQGEIFTWGKKLHVYDAGGTEVAFIHQKVWSWLPRYFVQIGGQDVCEIVREFTFFRPSYQLRGLRNWRVDGNLWAHEYSILDGEAEVMQLTKHWFTWGDSYELRIVEEKDALISVCVALAIDAVMASQAAASSSSHGG